MRGPAKDSKPSQQAEFSQAIAFINKIKARYQNDPDVYKSFLEILQNYQAKTHKTAEAGQNIYNQVRRLLANTPDLMDEFRAFLPEISAAEPAGGWDSKPEKPRRKPGAPGPSTSAAQQQPQGATQKRKKRPEKEEIARPSPQKVRALCCPDPPTS